MICEEDVEGQTCACIYTRGYEISRQISQLNILRTDRANELTVCAGHLEVRDHPQDVVHLIGSLLSLNDAVRRRIGRVDVNHVQQVDPCV